jgi:PTH1 family peptidyl-tRNA hydrolase
MKLVVGLGNPGPQYETTRHNAGFLMIDLIAESVGATWESGSNKFGGDLAKGSLLSHSCLFLKPMTFMNRSGRSVGEVARFFKIAPPDIVVLHDDIDVPSGKVKARESGGHGGNNGIRSIIDENGYDNFHRIKLGVGRSAHPGDAAVSNWVLGQFTDEELKVLQGPMLEDVKVRLKGIFEKSTAKPV